nr:hypothetical protein [Crateriforma spongiae]
MKHATRHLPAILLTIALCPFWGGCSLFPETRYRQRLHNPFPQLKRVAVLPFYNQSQSPTLDTEQVAEAYYAALQAVPGFEVLPVGVTKAQWHAYAMQFGEPTTGQQFQNLARFMNVEAVVVGSVTDYESYYPPRMAMTVHWYAANEGFHEIPPGYGLPWGTEAEEDIPSRIVQEAEFELARSQLATQSPTVAQQQPDGHQGPDSQATVQAGYVEGENIIGDVMLQDPLDGSIVTLDAESWTADGAMHESLPPNFPGPVDLIPDPPAPVRPVATPTHKPVLAQTRMYRGDDPYFTARLADYVETGDDARGMGWQGYLKRSDDFVRFCCHLHIAEMLESRGGADQSDLILRWPLSRY